MEIHKMQNSFISFMCIRLFRVGQPTYCPWENLSSNFVKRKGGLGSNLNDEQIKVIRDILINLQRVDEFSFSQHIVPDDSELHIFVDTSSGAAYIVSPTNKCSNLLISKARVAPCRENRLTIPKLELTASLVGARLIWYLLNIFKFNNVYLWSDSKVTISWITSDRDVKDSYVANRVAEVKTLVINHNINIMYVPTKDNPADHLSRGCTSKKLKSSNWLYGPTWLLTGEFPEQSNLNIIVNVLTVEINPIHPTPPIIDLLNSAHSLKCSESCHES